MSSPETLYSGKYLQVLQRDKWEYVARANASAVVAIAALFEGQLVLTEQFRPPVGCTVIDLPAGLVGDEDGEESSRRAAARELQEEAGFIANRWEHRITIPTSPGLTSETVQIFIAEELTRESDGGGVDNEEITVHLIPMNEMVGFIRKQSDAGLMIDPKVFVALQLLG